MQPVKVIKKEDRLNENKKPITLNKHKAREVSFEVFINKRVVIQCKNSLIVKGTYVGYPTGKFHLQKAEVISKNKKVYPENIFIDGNSISHIHEECEFLTI